MSKVTDSMLFSLAVAGGGSGGGITPSGTKQITENGTHDVAQYASAAVAVPNSYEAADEGKVVSNGALVAQTSKTVTVNGTIDTTENNEVIVNVPSSGGNPYDSKWAKLFNGNEQNGSIDITFADWAPNYTNDSGTASPTGCTKLRIYESNGIYLKNNMFMGCTFLEEVRLPNITWATTGSYSNGPFYGCSSLRYVALGLGNAGAFIVGAETFYNLAALEKVEIGGASSIAKYGFLSCSKLAVIHITSSSVVNLSNQYSISGCGADVGGTVVYVPDNLLSQYLESTNWAAAVAAGSITIKGESEMPTA